MAFCKNCGTQLKEGAAFCKNCGVKVGEKLPISGLAAGNVYGMMPTHSGGRYEDDAAEQVLKKLSAGKDIAVEKAKEANDRFQKWLPGAKENVAEKYKNVKEKIAEGKNQLLEKKAGAPAEDVIYCSECGAPSNVGNKFCGKCGTPLN